MTAWGSIQTSAFHFQGYPSVMRIQSKINPRSKNICTWLWHLEALPDKEIYFFFIEGNNALLRDVIFITISCIKCHFIFISFYYFIHFCQHYGGDKSELEAKVWYLTCVKQFSLYGCTLFHINHKGMWSHTSESLLAINMDGVKFVRSKDRSVIHEFKYTEIESILIDPNESYITLELFSQAQTNLAQKTFMFETNHKEDIGHLIASYSPTHASWMKSEKEGMKRVCLIFFVILCIHYTIVISCKSTGKIAIEKWAATDTKF